MRRLWKRHHRGDDGLGLIETVSALVVFALVMSGLAAGMAVFAHTTALTKVRNAATATAQQMMERAHRIPVDNLVVCSGQGSPTQYKPIDETTSYDVLAPIPLATPCLTFSQQVTNSGYTFTVKQYVLAKATAKDVQGHDQVEKLLVVNVAWTVPTPGSYEDKTILSGKGTIGATDPVGLRINVVDSSTSPAPLIADDDLVWNYTVKDGSGNTVVPADGNPDSAETADGTTGVISVAPGSYTCSITAGPDAAQSYMPDSSNNGAMQINSATYTISGACQVTAGAVFDWTTSWLPVTTCGKSTTKGVLQVTVTDAATGAGLNGASVTTTNSSNAAGASGTTATVNGIDGVVSLAESDDLYTYSVSLSGYSPVTLLGPKCVSGTGTAFAEAQLTAISGCAGGSTTSTVSGVVKDETGAVVGGATVYVMNISTSTIYHSAGTKADGSYTIANVPKDGYYYWATKKNYTTTSHFGPVCVPATSTINVTLPNMSSYSCAQGGSPNGTFQISVKDTDGNALSGVKILIEDADSVNGDQTPTSDSNGNISKAVAPGPWFLSVATPGYLNVGWKGPVCLAPGDSATVPFVLQGIMSVKVPVKNGDTQPTKNYNVILRDSAGNETTNSITVNKGATVTAQFNNLPTDTYSLTVCVPVVSTDNCNIVYSSTGNKWTTINKIYTLATITDASGNA